MGKNGYAPEVSRDGAMVVLLIKELSDAGQGYIGRTALQKLCYFARELSVPIEYRFQIYYYGPYAEELAMDVERMVAYGILKDLSNDKQKYSDYRPGPDAQRVLDEHRGAVDKYAPTIRKVTGMFNDLKPETLELLSTLHFIDRRLRATGTGDAPREHVVAELRSVKADKFEKWKVEDAFDAMHRVGLLGT